MSNADWKGEEARMSAEGAVETVARKAVWMRAGKGEGRKGDDRQMRAEGKTAEVSDKRPLAMSDRDPVTVRVTGGAPDGVKKCVADWLTVGDGVRERDSVGVMDAVLVGVDVLVGDGVRERDRVGVGDRLFVGQGDAEQTAGSPPGSSNVAGVPTVLPLPVNSAASGSALAKTQFWMSNFSGV
jgi:hypothetical protein